MKKKTRIGFECLYADPGRTFGTWNYAVNLLAEMSDLDAENEYIVFLSQKAAHQFPLTRRNLVLAPSRFANGSTAARILYQNLTLPLLAKVYRLDLLHSMGNYGSMAPLVRSVVTVHDLIASFNSRLLAERPFGLRNSLRRFVMRNSLRGADGVVAVSEFTKLELTSLYPFVTEKVRVIYPGLPRRGIPSVPEADAFLESCGVSRPYLLSVGICHPHKNISRLVQAFTRVKEQLPKPYQLVLVGNPGPDRDQLFRAVSEAGIEKHVKFTGIVSEETLQSLYTLADLFVYPSLVEGFGLPLLEAMANRTPVACSNAGSLPEVAGDAALLFDPGDVEDMTRAIRQVLEDGELRSRLIERGLKRVGRFSFRQAAVETLELYREVLQGKK